MDLFRRRQQTPLREPTAKKHPAAHSGFDMSAAMGVRGTPLAQRQGEGGATTTGVKNRFFYDGTADRWARTAKLPMGRKAGTSEEKHQRLGRKQSNWVWVQDPSLDKDGHPVHSKRCTCPLTGPSE